MNRLRLFPAMLGLMVLQACMTAPTPPTNASAAAAIPTSQTFLFSWGMFADPVFDRDVVTFDRAYSQSFGAPTQTELFGFTAARLNDPNPANMQNDLTQMAAQAVDGQDLIIVMMTSHGSPDLMAI